MATMCVFSRYDVTLEDHDGSMQIASLSPLNISRSPLPPGVRAVNLTLIEENGVSSRPKFDPCVL